MTTLLDKSQMDANRVLPWAEVLRRRLLPACEKIVLAGSLRRCKARVGDVEMVLLPRYDVTLDATLFGDGQSESRWEYSGLTELLERYVRDGMLAWDTDLKRNGPRYKRLRAVALDKDGPDGDRVEGGLPVDLFIADRHNFGNTLAIRTGSQEFSKALVTRRQYGGLMPNDLRQENGYLWRGPDALTCPTEGFFFEMLGVPVIAPQERSAEVGAYLAKERARRA